MLEYLPPRLSEMLYTTTAVPQGVPEAQGIHPPGLLPSHWPKQLKIYLRLNSLIYYRLLRMSSVSVVLFLVHSLLLNGIGIFCCSKKSKIRGECTWESIISLPRAIGQLFRWNCCAWWRLFPQGLLPWAFLWDPVEASLPSTSHQARWSAVILQVNLTL